MCASVSAGVDAYVGYADADADMDTDGYGCVTVDDEGAGGGGKGTDERGAELTRMEAADLAFRTVGLGTDELSAEAFADLTLSGTGLLTLWLPLPLPLLSSSSSLSFSSPFSLLLPFATVDTLTARFVSNWEVAVVDDDAFSL